MEHNIFEFIDNWKSGPVFITGVRFDEAPYEDNHKALTNLYYTDETTDGYQHGISDNAYRRVKQDFVPGSLLLTHADMGRVDQQRPIIAVDEVLSEPQWWPMHFIDGSFHNEMWSFFVDRIAHSPWGVGSTFKDLFVSGYCAYQSPTGSLIRSWKQMEAQPAINQTKVLYLDSKQ